MAQALKEKQNLEYVLREERKDRHAQALALSTAQRKTQADLEEVAAIRDQRFSEISANVCLTRLPITCLQIRKLSNMSPSKAQ
jgi:hypothetical protein